MAQASVLGIGNILLQDEGVGVRVIEHIRNHYRLADEVQVIDGGTMGLDLLPYLEVEQLLVVDAVDAGEPPGTIVCLRDREVPAHLNQKISSHHIGLADILSITRLRGTEPRQIVLIGIQPASLDVGLELSPTISAQVPTLVEQVLQEVRDWGYHVEHQS
jgi:hydrogenase maturation protease